MYIALFLCFWLGYLAEKYFYFSLLLYIPLLYIEKSFGNLHKRKWFEIFYDITIGIFLMVILAVGVILAFTLLSKMYN